MTLLAFGGVEAIGDCWLDDIQFTTDPGKYSPLTWEKSATAFYLLEEKTVQDFGTIPGKVTLASDVSTPIDTRTMMALHAKFRTKGNVSTFKDAFGNEFSVFIMSFLPTYDVAGLWQYTMELEILSITKLFAEAYSG